MDRRGEIVRFSGAATTRRTAVIRSYDSLIVDSRQFEALWPKNQRVTDRDRYRFLREARRRNLDEAEIERLTDDWSLGFVFSWVK